MKTVHVFNSITLCKEYFTELYVQLSDTLVESLFIFATFWYHHFTFVEVGCGFTQLNMHSALHRVWLKVAQIGLLLDIKPLYTIT